MRKITGWVVGFLVGGGVGAALIALFTPISAEEVRARITQGYESTMEEARKASEARRTELLAELEQMRGTASPEVKNPTLR